MTAPREPTATEFLLGYVTAQFYDKIQHCYDLGRRHAYRYDTIDGLRIPSTRLLAVFVFAAQKRIDLDAAIQLTKDSNPRGTKELSTLEARLKKVMSGKVDWTHDLLEQLSVGLGATSAQKELIAETTERLKPRVTKPDPEMIARVLRKHKPQPRVQQTRHQSVLGGIAAECLVHATRSLRAHEDLPPYYPNHLRIADLASFLTGTPLEPGWERGSADITSSLYSGLSRTSDAQATSLIGHTRRCIVLGDPGHGKSTVLLAQCLNHVNHGKIALLARLDDIGRLVEHPARKSAITKREAAEIIVQASELNAGIDCHSQDVREHLIEHVHTDEQLLLAFDGLDEISTDHHRMGVEQLLRVLAEIPGQIVIASRITGYLNPMRGSSEILVNRMSLESTREFIKAWFSDQADDVVENRTVAALDDSDLEELSSVPLLAGFVCYVSAHEEVKTTKPALYQQYLGLYFERRWKPPHQRRLNTEAQKQILDAAATVAWFMATQPSPDRNLPPIWLDHVTMRELSNEPTISNAASELAETDGLLIAHGKLRNGDRLGQRYRWLHRTIQEHLVGHKIAQWLKTDVPGVHDFLRIAALRPAWREPIEHASGILGNSVWISDLIDYFLTIHDTGDSFHNSYLDAAEMVLSSSASSHRRSELARRLIEVKYFYSAFQVDSTISRNMVKEIKVDDLNKHHLWALSDLAPDLVEMKFSERSSLSIDNVNQYIDAISHRDRNAARQEFEKLFNEGILTYFHETLYEDIDSSLIPKVMTALESKYLTQSSWLEIAFGSICWLAHSSSNEVTGKAREEVSKWDYPHPVLKELYLGIFDNYYREPNEYPQDALNRALQSSYKELNDTSINQLLSAPITGEWSMMCALYLEPDRILALGLDDHRIWSGLLLKEQKNTSFRFPTEDWNPELVFRTLTDALTMTVNDIDNGLGDSYPNKSEFGIQRKLCSALEWCRRTNYSPILPSAMDLLGSMRRISHISSYTPPLINSEWLQALILSFSPEDIFSAYCKTNVHNRKYLGWMLTTHIKDGQYANYKRSVKFLREIVNSETGTENYLDVIRDISAEDITRNGKEIFDIIDSGKINETRLYAFLSFELDLYTHDLLPSFWDALRVAKKASQ